LVPVVVGAAVVVVLVVALIMAIGLRGGAKRDDASGLRSDVEGFTTVLLSSRPPERAYDHLAEACREQISFDEFAVAVDEARLSLEEEFDVELGRLAVAEVGTREVVDGETGRARVSLEEIGLDEIPVGDVFVATGWNDWVYEAGLWRASDCGRPGDLVVTATTDPSDEGE
jgi:hypothetical protein